jgi:transposase-like protein
MRKEKKQIRHFSEPFKKEKVKQIEEKKVTVLQLSRIYEVSETAIYKWIRKYSKFAGINERVVIEKESEGQKMMELMREKAELERLVGQKQIEIEYLKKVIEFGSELTETDIKKKYESKS